MGVWLESTAGISRQGGYPQEKIDEIIALLKGGASQREVESVTGIGRGTYGKWVLQYDIYNPASYPKELVEQLVEAMQKKPMMEVHKEFGVAKQLLVNIRVMHGDIKWKQSKGQGSEKSRSKLLNKEYKDREVLLTQWFTGMNKKPLFGPSLADRIKAHLEEIKEWKMAA